MTRRTSSCVLAVAAFVFTIPACTNWSSATVPPAITTIHVVARDWHTDVCIDTRDADTQLMRVAKGYDGSRFLCFGFGDRHYLLSRERGPLTLLSALLPGNDGVILVTILRDKPAAAFGADNAVQLDVDARGIERLRAFLNHAIQIDEQGAPVSLGDGPYPGGLYFGATARYYGFYTCNTWTADALREAGIPIQGPVLFAEGVMRQVRDMAAARHIAPQPPLAPDPSVPPVEAAPATP